MPVEGVHGRLDSLSQPAIGSIGADLHHLGGQIALIWTKRGKHVVRGLPGPTDADAEALDLVGAEGGDDVAQPVVAAGGAGSAQPEPPERQIDVVRDHEHVLRRLDVELAQRRPQYGAGPIHVAHRLHQQHAADRVGLPSLEQRRAIAEPALAGQLPPVGEQVDDAKADVVPRQPISLAWVAEPADHLHRPDGSGGPVQPCCGTDSGQADEGASTVAGGPATSCRAMLGRVYDGILDVPPRVDVVVIGGGIIGCAAAAMLADRGAHVLLVEQTAIGAGASGRNLGALQHPFDPALAPLHEDSLARYRALADRDPELTVGRRPAGLLLLNRDEQAAEEQAVRLGRSVPELEPELLSPADVHRLEPLLARGPAAIRLATGYPIPPAAATAAWATLAVEKGVDLLVGVAAEPAVVDGTATGVTLAGGRSVAAGAVLVAAGPWSPPLVDPAGDWRPIAPTYGVTVQLRMPAAPGHIVEEDSVDAINVGRPEAAAARAAASTDADPPSLFSLASAGGVSTLGSTFLPAEPDAGTVATLLLRRAARWVPSISSAEVIGRRLCARPQSVDGRPFIGPIGVDRLFVCAGHGPWGISTGPGSAALVVRAILDGTAPPEELAAARPT